MNRAVLGDVLKFAGVPERIDEPGRECFVTLKVRGGGAVQRRIKDGKTPVPFTGYRVRAGQFIYSRIDARNGAFAIVPASLDGAVVSKDFPVFDIRNDRVDSEYLLHYMNAGGLEREIRSLSFGATNRQRITEDRFLAFPFPLPPFDEQRRLVAVLDRAQAASVKRRQMLAHLDALGRAIFNAGVDHTRTRTIQDLLESGFLLVHKDGNHGSLYPRAEEFGVDGVPFLTAKVVADDGSLTLQQVDRLNEAKAESLKIGWIQQDDVLLSHNASVGKVAIYRGQLGRALIGTSLTCFRPDGSHLGAGFLAAALRTTQFQRQLQHDMAQTTRNQVPITAQRKLRIHWVEPSAQRHIVSQLDAVETAMDPARRALHKTEELLRSLQSRAFRGNL